MNMKQKKRLLNILLAVVCVAVIACVLSGNKMLCITGLGLCVIYGVIHSSIWRCPQCGGSLGRGTPKTCPNCETVINYEA